MAKGRTIEKRRVKSSGERACSVGQSEALGEAWSRREPCPRDDMCHGECSRLAVDDGTKSLTRSGTLSLRWLVGSNEYAGMKRLAAESVVEEGWKSVEC